MQTISGSPVSATDLISSCSQLHVQGDHANNQGNYELAVAIYESAAEKIEACFVDHEQDFTWAALASDGPVTPNKAAMISMEFKLCCRLGDVCWKFGRPRNAHRWAGTASEILMIWAYVICERSQKEVERSKLAYLCGLASSRMNSDARALWEFAYATNLDSNRRLGKQEWTSIKRKQRKLAGEAVSHAEEEVGRMKRASCINR